MVACDDWGQVVESGLDASGAFRLTGLHDGDWQVRAFAPRTQTPHSFVKRTDRMPEDLVRVVAGAATRFDIDVERDAPSWLRATISLDGVMEQHAQWTITRNNGRHDSGSTRSPEPDGSVAVRLACGQRYGVQCRIGTEPELVVQHTFDAHAGENQWHSRLAFGSLRGQLGGSPWPASTTWICSFTVPLARGRVHVVWKSPSGGFGPIRVPAGNGVFVVHAEGASGPVYKIENITVKPAGDHAVGQVPR